MIAVNTSTSKIATERWQSQNSHALFDEGGTPTVKTLSSSITYDSEGRIATVSSPNGPTYTYTYHPQTSEVERVTASGQDQPVFELKAKDRYGNVVWAQRGKYHFVSDFDVLGRVILSQQKEPSTSAKVVTQYRTESVDRIETKLVTNKDGKTTTITYGYDKLNNVTQVSADNAVTKRIYDPTGLLLATATSDGQTIYDYHPATLLPVDMIGPKQRVTRTYDDYGRINSLKLYEIDDEGNQGSALETTYAYDYASVESGDPKSLEVTTTFVADGRREIKHYDIHGQLHSLLYEAESTPGADDWAPSKKVVRSYDEGNRGWKQELYKDSNDDGTLDASPSLTVTEELTDDEPENSSGGYSVRMTEDDGTDTSSKLTVTDANGQLKRTVQSDQESFVFTQHPGTGLTKTITGQTSGIAYEFDYTDDAQLVDFIKVTYPQLLNGKSRQVSIEYDSEQRMQSATFRESQSSIVDLHRSYEYDNDGRLIKIIQDFPEPLLGSVSNVMGKEFFDLTYDANDRLATTKWTTSDDSETTTTVEEENYYAYDLQGHLIFEALKRNATYNDGYVRLYAYDGLDNRTHVRQIPQADALMVQTFTPAFSASETLTACVYLKTVLNHDNSVGTGAIKSFKTHITLSDGTNSEVVSLHTYVDGDRDELRLEADGKYTEAILNGDIELEIVHRPDDVIVIGLVPQNEEKAHYVHIPWTGGALTSAAYSFEVLSEDTDGTTTAAVTFSTSTWFGVSSTSNEITKAMDYDGLHRLERMTVIDSGSTIFDRAYQYTSDGHIYREVHPSYPTPSTIYKEYTYDLLGRLISVDSDPGQAGVDFEIAYAAGSWQRKTMTDAAGDHDYTWINGDLARITHPDDTETNYVSWQGSSVWQVAGDPAVAGSGLASVYTKNHRGDVTGSYGKLNAASNVDYVQQSAVRYDAEGNVVAYETADGSTGVLQSQNTDTVASGPAYRGYWYEGGTHKLYHLQNRHYEPALARFLQIDPAKAGTNWYAYAGGDPVNRWDPNGLDAIVIGSRPLDGIDPSTEMGGLTSRFARHLFIEYWEGPDDVAFDFGERVTPQELEASGHTRSWRVELLAGPMSGIFAGNINFNPVVATPLGEFSVPQSEFALNGKQLPTSLPAAFPIFQSVIETTSFDRETGQTPIGSAQGLTQPFNFGNESLAIISADTFNTPSGPQKVRLANRHGDDIQRLAFNYKFGSQVLGYNDNLVNSVYGFPTVTPNEVADVLEGVEGNRIKAAVNLFNKSGVGGVRGLNGLVDTNVPNNNSNTFVRDLLQGDKGVLRTFPAELMSTGAENVGVMAGAFRIKPVSRLNTIDRLLFPEYLHPGNPFPVDNGFAVSGSMNFGGGDGNEFTLFTGSLNLGNLSSDVIQDITRQTYPWLSPLVNKTVSP